jgi:hypothetical protein
LLTIPVAQVQKREEYIATCTTAVCVVVWLITLRGFGLDTGFIHYGDLQLHTLQLLTADTTIHN